MKKRKKPKKTVIDQIKYYDEDKKTLLRLARHLKTRRPLGKTNAGKGLGKFLAGVDAACDLYLKNTERPVSPGISDNIHALYYKYYTAKNIRPDVYGYNSRVEKKLDVLIERAIIIECGKLYDMRQKLKKPQSARLEYFLRNSFATDKYFAGGVNRIVHFENLAYALEAIDSAVSKRDLRRVKQSRRRMFYIHAGKTNSGKTYSSLQLLKNAEKGAYLSPLRLLALEVSDNLNNDGIPCSLITGEEEHLIENANHVASTVELADLSTHYNVVVIDECQMIADRARGHSWTRAIMNIQADEICLCTAPEALDVLIKVIDDCGDFYQVINHRRKTPLVTEDKPFTFEDVQPGDALVAFSKQKVNAIGAQLIKRGINVSVLYGALPYTARKQQFENFISGKSTVLVTTDAIGMGVNLPVRRIVFMEIYKFDGEANRLLASHEVKQIAGRAGRRGIFDTGYVSACSRYELEFIDKRLSERTEKIKGICVSFPKQILTDEYITLKNAVNAWECYALPDLYIKESLRDAASNIARITKLYNRLDIPLNKPEIFEMAAMPVDSHNNAVRLLWMEYIEQRLSGYTTLRKPYLKRETVDELLDFSKMLDTYFMCSRSWDMEIDFEWLNEKRHYCNEALINGLIDDVKRHTGYCTVCGGVLDWNNKSGVCQSCAGEPYQ